MTSGARTPISHLGGCSGRCFFKKLPVQLKPGEEKNQMEE